MHGVVSNAGILRDGTFHKMTFENWDAVLKVHLYGGYNVIRAAWPHFREQSYGRVVVATSTSGLFGNFGQTNYGAAKLGLVGLINTPGAGGCEVQHPRQRGGADRGDPDDAGHPAAGGAREADAGVRRAGGRLPVHRGMPRQRSVFIVGGGKVQRIALFQNDGVTFDKPPSVDDIAAHWAEITDLSAAQKAGFKLVEQALTYESLCRTGAFGAIRDGLLRYRRCHRRR